MWDASAVQVVWFVLTPEGLDASRLFEESTGAEPDSVQTNRSVSPSAPFLGLATGMVDGRQISVQVQPGRVDLVVQADPKENDYTEGPNVLKLPEELARIFPWFSAFSDRLPSVVRVSTIANLVSNAASAQEALNKCKSQIEIDFPAENVTDFVFQANKRSVLGDDIEVNRLLRWNVLEVRAMTMSVEAGAQNIVSSLLTYQSSLMLDFNTVLQVKPYTKAQQLTALELIHRELLSFAGHEHPLREFAK